MLRHLCSKDLYRSRQRKELSGLTNSGLSGKTTVKTEVEVGFNTGRC